MTMLPLPGSPLIGAGGACEDLAVSPASPLAVDQRGDGRPLGGPCDIGAVQIQAPSAGGIPVDRAGLTHGGSDGDLGARHLDGRRVAHIHLRSGRRTVSRSPVRTG